MVLRINIRFKLVNLDNTIRVRLIDVKSSQHVLNDDDISGSVNEFLEKCKCIPFMVPFATDLQKQTILGNLCYPTINHGAKISFVS